MITTYAIGGFLDYMKTIICGQFPVIDQYVYDENGDFNSRAIQYITRDGIFSKLEGQVPESWVMFIWNRESITEGQVHSRRMTFSSSLNDGTENLGVSQVRMGGLPVTLSIICSNIEMAEYIEEYLFVLAGETIVFDIDVPDFGTFSLSTEVTLGSNFEKLQLENYGSATKIEKTFTINYPIILPKVYTPSINGISNRIGCVTGEEGLVQKVREQDLN